MSKLNRALALGGVAGPVLFTVAVVVSASLRPDYSHLTNFISELGASGTPHAALMNYAGFIPAGLLIAASGVALAAILPRRRLPWISAALVTLFGLGLAASGAVSCDPGCPRSGGSLESRIHDIIAPVTFLSLIVGAGAFGIYARRDVMWRPLSVYSLLTSAWALCLLIGLAASLETRTLTGLWQRLLLAVLFLWCAFAGWHASRHPARDDRPHGGARR